MAEGTVCCTRMSSVSESVEQPPVRGSNKKEFWRYCNTFVQSIPVCSACRTPPERTNKRTNECAAQKLPMVLPIYHIGMHQVAPEIPVQKRGRGKLVTILPQIGEKIEIGIQHSEYVDLDPNYSSPPVGCFS